MLQVKAQAWRSGGRLCLLKFENWNRKLRIPHNRTTIEKKRTREIEEWFPGEVALVNESNRDLWSPIINRGETESDEKDRNEGVERYSSTRKLLEKTFETSRDYVSIAERRAALDLWIGWVCSMLDVDNHCTWRTEIPNGGGRFLMTGKDCPPQHGHNDFDVKETGSPGYFTIRTASEPISLWIAPGS